MCRSGGGQSFVIIFRPTIPPRPRRRRWVQLRSCSGLSRGTRRSGRPHRSISASGLLAAELTAIHDLDCPAGERSPLSAPYDHGARVLLLGVQANKATALHLAEYRASCIGKHLVAKRRPVLVDGKRRWLTWEEMWVDDHDFIDVDARSPRRSRPTFSLPLSERRGASGLDAALD